MWKSESLFGTFRHLLLTAVIACGLLSMVGSSITSDDDSSGSDDGEPNYKSVTTTVQTNGKDSLIHPDGAKLDIPLRAVPKTETGAYGTMVFSIESEATPPSTDAPEGMVLGDFYRFGPGGFIFARPVKITLPVSDPLAKGLTLVVYDDAKAEWIPVPSAIDRDNSSISAYTQHFSFWSTAYWTDRAWEARENDDWGTLHGETPSSPEYDYSVCIESYTLVHPEIDGATFDSTMAIMTAVTTQSSMRLPQGEYTLGVTAFDRSTGKLTGHQTLGVYTISAYDAGFNWDDGAHIDVWPIDEFETGMGCFAPPTSSPGTGEVQVTLAWRTSSSSDLDLKVMDPRGEIISFANKRSESGGELDLDNRCADFVEGRPENIYWLRDAPLGEYAVGVVYFSDCLNTHEVIAFDVRVINKGVSTTYSGTVTMVGDSTEVARFTVR